MKAFISRCVSRNPSCQEPEQKVAGIKTVIKS